MPFFYVSKDQNGFALLVVKFQLKTTKKNHSFCLTKSKIKEDLGGDVMGTDKNES